MLSSAVLAEAHCEATLGDLFVSAGGSTVPVAAVESGEANRWMGNHTSA